MTVCLVVCKGEKRYVNVKKKRSVNLDEMIDAWSPPEAMFRFAIRQI